VGAVGYIPDLPNLTVCYFHHLEDRLGVRGDYYDVTAGR
jgi:hypothetical protein